MSNFIWSFWWLIFPIGGMIYAAFQSWLKYRQQKAVVGRGIQRMLELLSDDRRSENPLAPQEEQVARKAVDVLLGKFDEPGVRRERHTRETLRETLVQLSKQRY